MSSAITHVLLPAESPGMESDTHWHLYDDWEGEFLSTGGKLCSGEAGLQLLTPTMLTAIGELYALKAFRFQHIPEQAAAALEEVKPQLRLPDPLGWKSPISAKQRAAEEHAAVQPEKGKTYPPSGCGQRINTSRARWKPTVGMLKFRVMKSAPGEMGVCEQSVSRPHVWALTALDALDLVNQVMGADHSVDIKPVEE